MEEKGGGGGGRIDIQGRELYLGDFIRNIFYIHFHLDAHEQISFILGAMMIDMTTLHILIPVCMTLTFIHLTRPGGLWES